MLILEGNTQIHEGELYRGCCDYKLFQLKPVLEVLSFENIEFLNDNDVQ